MDETRGFSFLKCLNGLGFGFYVLEMQSCVMAFLKIPGLSCRHNVVCLTTDEGLLYLHESRDIIIENLYK